LDLFETAVAAAESSLLFFDESRLRFLLWLAGEAKNQAWEAVVDIFGCAEIRSTKDHSSLHRRSMSAEVLLLEGVEPTREAVIDAAKRAIGKLKWSRIDGVGEDGRKRPKRLVDTVAVTVHGADARVRELSARNWKCADKLAMAEWNRNPKDPVGLLIQPFEEIDGISIKFNPIAERLD